MRLVGSKRAVRTPEFHKRQERRRKFNLVVYGIIVVVLLISPVFILRSSKQLVSQIDVVSGTTSGVALKSLVERDISGSYFGLFPKRSAFLVPKETIVADVLKAFPQLASATVSRNGLNALKLETVERTPSALYCSDKCYFVDETGFIFDEAPSFTPGVYSVFRSNPVLDNPVGQTLLTAEELKTLESFYTNLPRLSITPLYIQLSSTEVRIYVDGGAYLVWNRDQAPTDVFSNLETVLANKVIKLADLSTLEYIDLRFGEKVFYRFKNE